MRKPIEYTREQRDKAIAEVLMGASLLKAGALVGARPDVVRRWLAEDGVQPADGKKRKGERRADVLAALATGETQVSIAKRFGIDRATVCRWLAESKLAGGK
jgi:DNA invertase Pin-like site-specific DNA recombinase